MYAETLQEDSGKFRGEDFWIVRHIFLMCLTWLQALDIIYTFKQHYINIHEQSNVVLKKLW